MSKFNRMSKTRLDVLGEMAGFGLLKKSFSFSHIVVIGHF